LQETAVAPQHLVFGVTGHGEEGRVDAHDGLLGMRRVDIYNAAVGGLDDRGVRQQREAPGGSVDALEGKQA
jgi:hypothetical protein